MTTNETPRGGALMRVGVGQVVTGVYNTVANEIMVGAGFGVTGLLVGAGVGLFVDKGVVQSAKDAALAMARLGAVWGWETAHLQGNRDTKWHHWVFANLIALHRENKKKVHKGNPSIQNVVVQQIFNTESIAGMEKVVRGIGQAALG